ncbi:cobalamin-dependent protein, partial [Planctomycetota bacterium]
MKIVYLNGPYRRGSYSRSSRSPAVTKSGTIYYPVWLAYAAGLAREEGGFEVELIDAVARKYGLVKLLEHLKASSPDVVICDSSTPSIYEDAATAGAIRQASPSCRVVMVGTHATARPQEVLRLEEGIDAVALGEYEITAVELARALQEGKSW